MENIITGVLGGVLGAVLGVLAVFMVQRLQLRHACQWVTADPTKGPSPAHGFGCPCGLRDTPDSRYFGRLA